MIYLALNKTIQLKWKWSQYSFLQWCTWYKKCLIVIADKNKNLQISSCQCLIKVGIQGVCFFWCWTQSDNIQQDTHCFKQLNGHSYQKGEVFFSKWSLVNKWNYSYCIIPMRKVPVCGCAYAAVRTIFSCEYCIQHGRNVIIFPASMA